MKKFIFVTIAFLLLLTSCKKNFEGENYEVMGKATTYLMVEIKNSVKTTLGVNMDFSQIADIAGVNGFHQLMNSRIFYQTVAVKYRSVDVNGHPIWLSGRFYYPIDVFGNLKIPDHIVLYNHHTVGKNSQVPSQSFGPEACIVANSAFVVAPDYLGFGTTVDQIHPYCIPEITARNALDMLRAAWNYMADNGIYKPEKLPMYNVGYSQGASAALAILKYTQDHPEYANCRFDNTYCGGGPFSMETMFLEFLESDSCGYPVSVPLVLIGLKTAFPEILTEDYDAYMTQNMVEMIPKVQSKNINTDDLNAEIRARFSVPKDRAVPTSKMLTVEARTPGNPVYEQLMAALRKCELSRGWSPNSYIHFMHSTTDNYVTYTNFRLVQNNLSNSYTSFEPLDYELLQGHVANGVLYFVRTISGEYLVNYYFDK